MLDIMGCLGGVTVSSPTVTKFSNPTVTGINNIFWDFKFVGLFYRMRSELS